MAKKKRNILIIEDEEGLRETLKLKLTQEGFEVTTATDGKTGIAKISDQKPDLVLLDLLLPHLPGQEVLRKIKQDDATKEIPVIIISNSGQPVEMKELLELGADDYIVKADFTIDDILERVYNTLEKEQGQIDVLLSEDESSLRLVLAKKLRLEGFRVITALDGDTALKSIREVRPRVVMLDLLMPGMSGIDVLNALKKDETFNKEETKIFVLSNYSGKETDPIVKEMVQDYFIKSNFDIDDIVAKVKEVVGG